MISKNKIKYLCSLKIKKYREKNLGTILEGLRLIEQAIDFSANIGSIWITHEFKDSNNLFLKKIESKNINYDIISDSDMKIISDTKNSQGIIAEVNISKYLWPISQTINDNLVVIDSISDPGNLGTIFRTCAWYGIKTMMLNTTTTDPFNFKCIRSGMGAHFYFNQIISDSNKNIINFLKSNNYDILCADLNGNNFSRVNPSSKWAIIFGSEAHGISEDFDRFNKVTIKGSNSIESLNVSVSAGIILEHLINSK